MKLSHFRLVGGLPQCWLCRWFGSEQPRLEHRCSHMPLPGTLALRLVSGSLQAQCMVQTLMGVLLVTAAVLGLITPAWLASPDSYASVLLSG